MGRKRPGWAPNGVIRARASSFRRMSAWRYIWVVSTDSWVKCSRTIGGSFNDRKGLDYVYCDRSEGSGLVERRWQVAIVHREGKVTEC